MDSVKLSKKIGGKIEIRSKEKLTKKTLSFLYTPGVAEVSKAIAKNKNLSKEYTIRKNMVAVVSDGSAVLGLGNIGPEAALPVMEGKCLLFKELAGVDAVPIVLGTQDTEELIRTIKYLSPTFGGINLEDICAPKCFEIEKRLKKELDIPVFHDDQHGTAIVILAGLINALKVVKKEIKDVRIVISGVGAAGIATAKLLLKYGAKNIIMIDSQGIIYKNRDNLNSAKKEISMVTNKESKKGGVREALKNADVFIGVSAPNILTEEDIRQMNKNSIVFAMANPIPEIMPDRARAAGAKIVATGRSDFPNQLNNILVFPGIFRGVLDRRSIREITDMHKIAAAQAISGLIKKPTSGKIIPEALDKRVVKAVSGIFKIK